MATGRSDSRPASTCGARHARFVLTPLGKGDWNTLATGYRRIADQKGLAVTLREKIERNPRLELTGGRGRLQALDLPGAPYERGEYGGGVGPRTMDLR